MKHKMYFHELTMQEYNKLLKSSVTWEYILDNYKQPYWCTCHKALDGDMGCWTLTSTDGRLKINKEFCKKCDYFSDKGSVNKLKFPLSKKLKDLKNGIKSR